MRHEAIRTGVRIHPAWCSCSRCTQDGIGSRLIIGDVVALVLGSLCGLIVLLCFATGGQ